MNLQHLCPSVAAAIKAQSGRPVGISRPPGSPVELAGEVYAIVHQLFTDVNEPSSFADPYDMIWIGIQVTSVAENSEQASWMSDQVRLAIIGRTGGVWNQAIEPTGLQVCGRTLAISAGIEEEDGVFNSYERYRLLVTG